MAGPNEVEIDVISKDKSGPGFDSARRNASKLEKDGGGAADALSGKLKGLGIAAGAAAATIAVDLAVNAIGKLKDYAAGAIDAASNLNESMNAVDKIFKGSSDTIKKWGETQANAYGLSQRAFQELATPLGALLKNQGVSQDKLAETTINLTKRAADLASVFNTDVSDALDAITAGMRGESDPLERYGVSLSEAAVKAEAFSLGLVKAGKGADVIQAAQIRATLAQKKYNEAVREHGANSDQALRAQVALINANKALDSATNSTSVELTKEQEAAARLSLIMKQTSDSAGDFAQTSNGLANSSRILAARQEELQAKIGQKLLPLMNKLNEIKLAALEYLGNTVFPMVVRHLRELAEGFQLIWQRALPQLRILLDVIKQKWEENRDKIEKLMPLLKALGIFLGVTLVAALVVLGGLAGLFIDWLGQVGDYFERLTKFGGMLAIRLVDAFEQILDAAVYAFSWIPGIGDKLREAQGKFREFAANVRAEIEGIPEQKIVDVRVQLSGAEAVGNALSALRARAGISARAHGGVIGAIAGAASGGVRNGLVNVGEHGRELALLAPGPAMLPPGSTVIPNGATENALASGGGGGMREVALVVDGVGDDWLVEILNRLLRKGKLRAFAKA